jgi:hypothetical protein
LLAFSPVETMHDRDFQEAIERHQREFNAMIDEATHHIGMQKLSLEPGEFLVFTCDMILDKEQTQAVRSRLKAALPSGVPFLFLSGGVDVFRSNAAMMTADGTEMMTGGN